MAETVINRGLRMSFEEKGAAKLAGDVAKVDKGLAQAGKTAEAATGKIGGGLSSLSERAAQALGPVDKLFSASDKLFSILGKAGAVGALAVGAWEAMKAAADALSGASKSVAEQLAEEKKAIDELTAAAGQYAGRLRELNLLEIVRGNKELQEAIGQVAAQYRELEKAEEVQARKAELRAQAEEHWLRTATSSAEGTIRTVEGVISAEDDRADRLRRATLGLEAATAAEQDAAAARAQSAALVAEYSERVDAVKASLDALTKTTGKGTEDAGKLTAALKVQEAEWEEWQRTLDLAAANAGAAMAEAVSAQNLATLAAGFDAVVESAQQLPALMRRTASASSQALDAMAPWVDFAEQIDLVTSAIGRSIDAFGAQAAAAVFARASIQEVLNAQLQALAIEAAWQAVKAGALALGSLAFGDLRSAAIYGEQAGLWTLLAAGAGAGAALSGGFGGGSGSSGGATTGAAPAGGSEGLTGQSSAAPGPVVVNLNLSGPIGGIGRLLVDEINREAQRNGAARISATAVRR